MHPRFAKPFETLSAPLQAALLPMLGDDFQARFTPEQVATLKAATGLDDRALRLALLPLAAACSVAPISRFFVGAIACGLSGSWYFGANMEFAGQGLFHSVHAEQSAISNAWLGGETGISEITVNYTPCGHCRQFMNELTSGTELDIHLPDRDVATLGDYLPHSFGPKDLDITTLLMDKVDHGYQLDNADALTLLALDACNQSHAPYSKSYSGVALETHSGKQFAGRYAENAAFNPSLPPLQAALILLNMSGEDCLKVRRAVLVENTGALLTQDDATRATLKAIGCEEVKTVTC